VSSYVRTVRDALPQSAASSIASGVSTVETINGLTDLHQPAALTIANIKRRVWRMQSSIIVKHRRGAVLWQTGLPISEYRWPLLLLPPTSV